MPSSDELYGKDDTIGSDDFIEEFPHVKQLIGEISGKDDSEDSEDSFHGKVIPGLDGKVVLPIKEYHVKTFDFSDSADIKEHSDLYRELYDQGADKNKVQKLRLLFRERIRVDAKLYMHVEWIEYDVSKLADYSQVIASDKQAEGSEEDTDE